MKTYIGTNQSEMWSTVILRSLFIKTRTLLINIKLRKLEKNKTTVKSGPVKDKAQWEL